MKNPMFYLFLFFIAIGILSLVAGLRNYQHEEGFFATAEQDTATIKDYVPDPNPKAADFCPEYEFTTRAGQLISYVGDNCPTEPDYSQIGQTEQIYIDPAQPQIIESRGWTGSEGAGLIMGIAGAVFFPVIGLIVWGASVLSARRQAARKNSYAAAGSQDDEQAELARLEQQEAQLKRRIKARGK